MATVSQVPPTVMALHPKETLATVPAVALAAARVRVATPGTRRLLATTARHLALARVPMERARTAIHSSNKAPKCQCEAGMATHLPTMPAAVATDSQPPRRSRTPAMVARMVLRRKAPPPATATAAAAAAPPRTDASSTAPTAAMVQLPPRSATLSRQAVAPVARAMLPQSRLHTQVRRHLCKGTTVGAMVPQCPQPCTGGERKPAVCPTRSATCCTATARQILRRRRAVAAVAELVRALRQRRTTPATQPHNSQPACTSWRLPWRLRTEACQKWLPAA
jgi:hypothetical protein